MLEQRCVCRLCFTRLSASQLEEFLPPETSIHMKIFVVVSKYWLLSDLFRASSEISSYLLIIFFYSHLRSLLWNLLFPLVLSSSKAMWRSIFIRISNSNVCGINTRVETKQFSSTLTSILHCLRSSSRVSTDGDDLVKNILFTITSREKW